MKPGQAFLHRLALALHRTVGEIETTMSERELIDWHRYEATVSPLPDRLADMHFALLTSVVINRTRAANTEPVEMSEFYLMKDTAPSAQPPEDDGLTEAERAAAIWRGG